MSPTSSSREGRIRTPSRLIAGRAQPLGSDDTNGVAIEERLDVLDDLRVGIQIVLFRDVADVWSQDHVRRGAQRMVDRQGLFIVDVEPGIGEASLLQRSDNRTGVADWPARGVDNDRARLHQPDLTGADKAAAPWAKYEMHGKDVGAAEQLVLLDPLD